MKKKVICKVCGFIIHEHKLGEVCPACGVSRNAFEDYDDNVSEQRRKLLDMNVHSMVVHFPQAVAVIIFGLLFLQLISLYPSILNLMACCQVLTVILPISVLGAMITGLFDGKTRFKKLKTPILKLKITLAMLFFFLSLALSLFILLQVHLNLWLYLILSGICLLFSVLLGNNGGKLRGLAVPN
jgi:hypothetical protein